METGRERKKDTTRGNQLIKAIAKNLIESNIFFAYCSYYQYLILVDLVF